MRYLTSLLLIAASLALSACGGGGSSTGTGVINLNGGNGGSGAGGAGGTITTFSNSTSMVHGDLRFHLAGTVNAGFTVPGISPEFGNISTATTVARTITSETTVQTTASAAPGTYFVQPSDTNLYFVSGSGTAKVVTGLTVNAKLHLPANNVPTIISKGIVVNGTVTSDGGNLDLQSGTFLQNNGQVTTKPAAAGAGGGQLNLTSGGVLINPGTVDASGSDGIGAAGGASGGVTLHAATLLYNTGTVYAKGGKSDAGSGGAGGAIQLLADGGSAATSGTVDSSGGSGTSGGPAGPINAFGGADTSVVGRVFVSGTLNANGGIGTTGDGGKGEAISLTSFSGGILINAAISATGGTSAGGNGGAGGSLHLNNRVGSDSAALHQVSPEGIKVAGNISLNGGNTVSSGLQGGAGGTISIISETAGESLSGFGNVEFFSYKNFFLDGGSSVSGSGGAGGTMDCGVSSSRVVNVDLPAGGVYNEVALSARGGDNNPNAASKTAAGGSGGTVAFTTPQAGNTSDPLRTLVSNSGAIDIRGGAGDTGGSGGRLTMSGYGNVTNSGVVAADGGTGTTNGGDGSPAIKLFSSSSVGNSAVISASGASGATGGNGGSISLESVNQTSTSAVLGAAGGSSSTGGNGGNGGTLVLFTAYAPTSHTANSLNVVRGSGGSSNSAVNGTINIDGSFVSIPNSGII